MGDVILRIVSNTFASRLGQEWFYPPPSRPATPTGVISGHWLAHL
jgi:hypothetical protein